MALSLSIGSPAISLVQSGSVAETGSSSSITATLTTPSTAGTALVALVAVNFASVSTAPAGWNLVLSNVGASTNDLEMWIYPSNPGGISSAYFTFSRATSIANAQISEWKNLTAAATVDTSGTASSTSGTTLAPTTSGNVSAAAELAISVWMQSISAFAASFTTPVGWTRLCDDGALVQAQHLDAEYQINPTSGAPLGPTLTSDRTTTTSSGLIVVFKGGTAPADYSTYIGYGSLSLKLNTLDFTLVDAPNAITPGMVVTLSSPGDFPDWTGTISNVRASDIVNRATGHQVQTVSATNTQLPNFTDAPYDLSDNPATNSDELWLTEGSDFFSLENSAGDFLLESSVEESAYWDLSISQQVGSVTPLTYTTIGYVTVPAGNGTGFWPGQTFKLTSSNLSNWVTVAGQDDLWMVETGNFFGLEDGSGAWLLESSRAGGLYTIQTITITYVGANPSQPQYELQFGDQIQTLAEWTAAHV